MWKPQNYSCRLFVKNTFILVLLDAFSIILNKRLLPNFDSFVRRIGAN